MAVARGHGRGSVAESHGFAAAVSAVAATTRGHFVLGCNGPVTVAMAVAVAPLSWHPRRGRNEAWAWRPHSTSKWRNSSREAQHQQGNKACSWRLQAQHQQVAQMNGTFVLGGRPGSRYLLVGRRRRRHLRQRCLFTSQTLAGVHQACNEILSFGSYFPCLFGY